MTRPVTGAPRLKADDGAPSSLDVVEAFDEFMRAFEAFKEANDERLSQIEERVTADIVTVEKMDRIGRALDEHKRLVDELVLKGRRPPLSGERGALSLADLEHKHAFDAYVRRGDETALRRFERKSLAAGTGDGAYLVPEDTEREIGRRLAAASPIRAIASVRQMTGSVYKKPFVKTGPVVGWIGETAPRLETAAPGLAEIQVPAMELYAMPAASQTLLDDAAIDIDSWIAEEVETAFAEQEGTAFVSGDGSGKPKGFLAYTKIAEASWAWDSIGYVATGAAGAFPATDPVEVLIDLVYALKAGYRQNAHAVMNRRTQAEVRKLKDADGNLIWQPPAQAGAPATMLGFPIAESEDMPDIGTDAHAIALGDFGRGYLVVDRLGTRILRDPYSAKPYVLFYTTKRVGGAVQDFNAIKLLKFGLS